ncbi:MAG: hypothetical protein ACXW3L_08205, partial [Limisphaerales bacterium]
RGFVEDLKWKRGIRMFYAPLSFLDERHWHHPLLPGETTKYPINEVVADEIGRVYRANRTE